MLFFCALAGVAAFEDYCRRRIPNLTMLCMLVWGMIYSFREGYIWGVFAFLGIVALAVCTAFPLYKIGSIGAGDVKLIALCCGFLGRGHILSFLFFALFIAAIFSVCKVLYISNQREPGRVGICMAGPVFISLLLHLGGVY